MNPDSNVAVLLALISAMTTIVLSYFKLRAQLRETHDLVNSRMTELLDLTRTAATAKAKIRRRPRTRTLALPPV